MQPNPRKTPSFRELGEVDIDALRERVLAIPEAVWDAENASKPNRFDALSSTRHIVFRFISSPQSWTQSYDRPIWAAFRDVVMPVVEQAIAPYGYARPVGTLAAQDPRTPDDPPAVHVPRRRRMAAPARRARGGGEQHADARGAQ